MTAAADLVLTNAEVHTLGSPDETHEAVAVRDGEVVRVGRAFDVGLLAGVETRVVDCGGRVVLPGFIDAHTHLPMVGRSLVHADLSAAGSPAEAVELLRERAAEVESDDETGDEAGWVLGYGYDESTWDDSTDALESLQPSQNKKKPAEAGFITKRSAIRHSGCATVGKGDRCGPLRYYASWRKGDVLQGD